MLAKSSSIYLYDLSGTHDSSKKLLHEHGREQKVSTWKPYIYSPLRVVSQVFKRLTFFFFWLSMSFGPEEDDTIFPIWQNGFLSCTLLLGYDVEARDGAVLRACLRLPCPRRGGRWKAAFKMWAKLFVWCLGKLSAEEKGTMTFAVTYALFPYFGFCKGVSRMRAEH